MPLSHSDLQFLRWLLGQVTEPSVIHDILWQFMVSVSEHPIVEVAARAKVEQEEDKGKVRTIQIFSYSLNILSYMDVLCKWPVQFSPSFSSPFSVFVLLSNSSLQDLLKESGLGKHPLTGLDGAGSALIVLRKEFHSFLQTIADIMGKASGKKNVISDRIVLIN